MQYLVLQLKANALQLYSSASLMHQALLHFVQSLKPIHWNIFASWWADILCFSQLLLLDRDVQCVTGQNAPLEFKVFATSVQTYAYG